MLLELLDGIFNERFLENKKKLWLNKNVKKRKNVFYMYDDIVLQTTDYCGALEQRSLKRSWIFL